MIDVNQREPNVQRKSAIASCIVHVALLHQIRMNSNTVIQLLTVIQFGFFPAS